MVNSKCVEEQEFGELVKVTAIDDIAALPLHTEAIIVSHLNDEKISAVAKLGNLKTLLQDGNSSVSDAGLKVLGRIESLNNLDLEWSESITDTGIAYLYDLTQLKWLDIGFCRQLSQQGIGDLRANLPNCEIVAQQAGL